MNVTLFCEYMLCLCGYMRLSSEYMRMIRQNQMLNLKNEMQVAMNVRLEVMDDDVRRLQVQI